MNYYELFIRSFADGNGDGIGDFIGLRDRMDYIADLGVDSVWMLPIMPSPDFHNYTVMDLRAVNPLYGTVRQLVGALKAGHKRGLRFVLDLPINHVAFNSEWFTRARAGEKPYVDWFVWADHDPQPDDPVGRTMHRLWHPVDGKWFYGFFGFGSPDLNFETPSLWEEMKDVFAFWLDVGFDGFRLDAAKHIFDMNSRTLRWRADHKKNIRFWREIVRHVKSIRPDAICCCEVWDKAEVLKPYKNVFDITLNFPFSWAVHEAINTNRPRKLIDAIQAGMAEYCSPRRRIRSHAGNFLGNHDVARLSSAFSTESKARLALTLLYTLPGATFLLYGEEIAMRGKPVFTPIGRCTEEVEEPFQWYAGGFGPGQTAWKYLRANVPGSGRSVEEQLADETSRMHFVRDLLAFRRSHDWIQTARIRDLHHRKGVLRLTLAAGGHTMDLRYNFTRHPRSVRLRTGQDVKAFGTSRRDGTKLTLGPYAGVAVFD